MTNKRCIKLPLALLAILFICTALSAHAANDIPRMTKEELVKKMDSNSVIVVDVRSGRDWKSSEFMIHKAVREDPGQVASWTSKYAKDKTIVAYCA